MTEIQYCPVCGSEVEPDLSSGDQTKVTARVECPKHGQAIVKYVAPGNPGEGLLEW